MVKQTFYAVASCMMLWAVGVLAMGTMDETGARKEFLYAHSGSWTLYQDASGKYSVRLRGLVRYDPDCSG